MEVQLNFELFEGVPALSLSLALPHICTTSLSLVCFSIDLYQNLGVHTLCTGLLVACAQQMAAEDMGQSSRVRAMCPARPPALKRKGLVVGSETLGRCRPPRRQPTLSFSKFRSRDHWFTSVGLAITCLQVTVKHELSVRSSSVRTAKSYTKQQTQQVNMAELRMPVDNVEAVVRITRRIDAIGERDKGIFLGLSWYYIRLILLTGIGWAMDSMETFVFIYCTKLINADISWSPHQASFLGGAVFVGSFIGSFLFGSLSDKYGRRPMFMVTLVVFLIGLGLCGASWDINSLTIFRIISGIGLGGELPVASTLVQELSPAKTRGRIIVLLESFWAIGCMIAVWLAFGVAPHIGWRETFYLCCIPVLYSVIIRFTIPESPKWLASVGRYEEAVAIVENIERKHGLEPFDEKADLDNNVDAYRATAPQLPDSHIKRIALLFHQPFLVRTTVLWTLWFGISMSYYAIFIYLPVLVADGGKGYDLNGTWRSILLITFFQLPGYLVASALVEVWGRRQTLVLFLLGAFASAMALGYVPPHKTEVIISGSFLSFFMLGAWGCVYAYTPENYPTAIRGMGAAYPSGFSRIGAFSGPYLCAEMFGSWGMSLEAIMWVFGGVLVFISLVVLFFGYEPKGKNVEIYGDEEMLTALNSSKAEAFHGITTPGVTHA